MVHSNELRFGMHITDHGRMNPINYGEYRMNSSFTGVEKKNYYTLWPMESNSLVVQYQIWYVY